MLRFYFIYFFVINPIVLVASYLKARKAGQNMYVDAISTYLLIVLNMAFSVVQVFVYRNTTTAPSYLIVYLADLSIRFFLGISITTTILTWFFVIFTVIYVIRNEGKMLFISVDDKKYSGEEIHLTEKDIIVMDGDYQLRPGIDYVLQPESYRNNVKRGMASVNIRLFSGYSGFYKVTFRII